MADGEYRATTHFNKKTDMAKIDELHRQLTDVYRKLHLANDKIEALLKERAVQSEVVNNLKRQLAPKK